MLPWALGVTSSLQLPAVCEVIRDRAMRSWQEKVSMTKGILKGPDLLIATNHKVKPPINEGKGGRASLKTPVLDGRKT